MIYWLNYKFIVVLCVCVFFFWGGIYVYRLTLFFEKHKKKII